jgi:hypothetical protein
MYAAGITHAYESSYMLCTAVFETFCVLATAAAQDVAGECGVRAMPTFQAFFNGEKVDELTGADPAKLQAMIAK